MVQIPRLLVLFEQSVVSAKLDADWVITCFTSYSSSFPTFFFNAASGHAGGVDIYPPSLRPHRTLR